MKKTTDTEKFHTTQNYMNMYLTKITLKKLYNKL